MTTAILSPRPAPSKATPIKSAPELAKCPTCDHGRCARGTNCKACLDVHRRSHEARAEREARTIVQQELGLSDRELARLLPALGRLLLPHQAEGIVEMIGAVNDERGAT